MIVVNDSPTQQLPFKPEKTLNYTKDLSLLQDCRKRSNDNNDQIDVRKRMENYIITTGDLDKEMEPLRVETTKRKKVNEPATQNALKHQIRKKIDNKIIDDSSFNFDDTGTGRGQS